MLARVAVRLYVENETEASDMAARMWVEIGSPCEDDPAELPMAASIGAAPGAIGEHRQKKGERLGAPLLDSVRQETCALRKRRDGLYFSLNPLLSPAARDF